MFPNHNWQCQRQGRSCATVRRRSLCCIGFLLTVLTLRRPWCRFPVESPQRCFAGGQGAPALRIALTREDGQNQKLRKALEEALSDGPAVELVEIPCIEHGPGEHLEDVVSELRTAASVDKTAFPADVIILTSPEGARVFLQALSDAEATVPPVPIATVGRGTSAVLTNSGLEVAFEPSKANAETLAKELPAKLGSRALYLSSAIAPGTLQQGLEDRGFEVVRRNTYTTRAVEHVSEATVKLMEGTEIVTFGSPSAVRSWASHCKRRAVAACIGGTSRVAAEEAGFSRIYAPEKPGVPGWASVTAEAAASLLHAPVE